MRTKLRNWIKSLAHEFNAKISLSPRINSWAKAPVLCLLISGCATQDDMDVVFSDTEKAIIKTLIYTDPPDDPTSNYDQNSAAATLGQMFFWDKQFSGDIVIQGNRTAAFTPKTDDSSAKQINCVTCHNPSAGWVDNNTKPNDVSLGANFTSRNASTILNAAFNTNSLWDGATDSLWAVARVPIEGNSHNFHRYGVAYVICNSNTGPRGNYFAQYTAIFGIPDCGNVGTAPRNIDNPTTGTGNGYGKTLYNAMTSLQQATIDKIFANYAKAIAAYERLVVSKNSAFDQWATGNENAMTAAQKRGLKVFITKGNCIRCHSGPNFSDETFHNLGVPQVGGYSGTNDQGRADGIAALLDSTKNAPFNTAGLYNDNPSINRTSGVSATAANIGQFKVHTLRSVTKTAPYFHNGTFTSLWDVVNFYNFAGGAGNFPGTKDTALTTRLMTTTDMEDLVDFLKALEGEALSTNLTTNTAPTTASW